MKRALYVGVLLLCSVLLGGCNKKELEDRSFPLAAGMDKVGSEYLITYYFPKLAEVADQNAKNVESESYTVTAATYFEAWKAYEMSAQSSMDSNHMKVLVFGMDLFEDSDMLEAFLKYAREEEIFARNTLVFLGSKSAEEVLALNENLDEPIGTYLEEMVGNSDVFKENTMVTLGELYNEYYNRDEVLYVPVLCNNGGIPTITEYEVLDGFCAKGTIDSSEALNIFLLKNQLKQYSFKLENGEIVTVKHPSVEVEIVSDKEQVILDYQVAGEATILTKFFEGELAGQEEQLNQKLENMLCETVEASMLENNVDITSSYVKLGGYNRKLYERYKEDRDGYEKNLNYEIHTDVKLTTSGVE